MSSVNIVDRTRSGSNQETDYVMSMTGTDLARTMNIGSNWTWIRIGMRYEISSADTSTGINQPSFAFGLCVGTSSLYSSNTTYFIGVDLDPSKYLARGVGANSGQVYYESLDGSTQSPTSRMIVKNGSVINVITLDTFFNYYGVYEVSGSPQRQILFLDIIKQTTGSNNTIVDPGLWYVNWYYYGISLVNDVSASFFYAQMANNTASLGGNYHMQIVNNIPISSSAYGAFDTINIYWSKTTPSLEISDVAAWRFA